MPKIASPGVYQSRVYNNLRSKCMCSLAPRDVSARGQLRLQASQEVDAALREGSITVEQSRELYSILDGTAGLEGGASEEYVRLTAVYREWSERGVVTESQRAELLEEVELAFTSGGITAEEKESLMGLVNSDPAKTTAVPTVIARSVNDVPCRRRQAAKNKQHTEGYDKLVADYKGLYTHSERNMQDRISEFYAKVERSYATGEITLAEYHDCKRALDCAESQLSDVQVPTGGTGFSDFRDTLVASLSTDEAVSNIVRQIGVWAQKHGVSERIVRADPVGVAKEYYSDFLRSGERLVTSGMTRSETTSLLQMQLG